LRIKALGGTVFALAAVVASASAASAATTVTPSTNLVADQTVSATWSGLTGPAIISLCSKDPGDPSLTPARPADPTFDPSTDCNFSIPGSVQPAASGTAAIGLKNPDPALFGWACGISSSPADAPDQGTCWLRFTTVSQVKTDGQIGVPLTYNLTPTPDPVVPEAPLAILLPAGALGIAGLAFFINRRRHSTSLA
jgi:hypothetical protein